MIGGTTKILNILAKKGEITLQEAVKLNANHSTHVDQYPLALLIEAGFVGISMDSEKDEARTEEMLELKRAISLHMFTLPRDKSGCCEYMGARSCGNIDPDSEKVFLKAKGALYLDEKKQKFRERLISFMIGVSVGLIAAFFNAWIRGQIIAS